MAIYLLVEPWSSFLKCSVCYRPSYPATPLLSVATHGVNACRKKYQPCHLHLFPQHLQLRPPSKKCRIVGPSSQSCIKPPTSNNQEKPQLQESLAYPYKTSRIYVTGSSILRLHAQRDPAQHKRHPDPRICIPPSSSSAKKQSDSPILKLAVMQSMMMKKIEEREEERKIRSSYL